MTSAGLVYDESFSKGTIGLLVCTHTDTPLRVHFDNLKVWDISGLSLRMTMVDDIWKLKERS